MYIFLKCRARLLFEEGILQGVLADSGTGKSSCAPKSVSETLCSLNSWFLFWLQSRTCVFKPWSPECCFPCVSVHTACPQLCPCPVPTSCVWCPQCAGAAAAPVTCVSGVELDSLISQVKDLLPDLGEGFILACLKEYGYDTEQVINNILEDKLVPYLDKLDRRMQRCGTTSGCLVSLNCSHWRLNTFRALRICIFGVENCSESFSLSPLTSFLPSLCPYRELGPLLLTVEVEQVLGCVLWQRTKPLVHEMIELNRNKIE